MPDYGGAYGWVNRDGADTLGPNHADHSGWGGEHAITQGLHEDFVAWQTEFERAPFNADQVIESIDWVLFHQRGLALARRLKVELGDSAAVLYVKPIEDPNYLANQRVELALDGSTVERPWVRRRGPRHPAWLPSRIVSGGQTGADRAALDWAIRYRIVHGGWCPKGRASVDGPIPARYQLQETESAGYRQRTRLNVRDSDATLVLNAGDLDGGTLQTVRFAHALGKPLLLIQLDEANAEISARAVTAWLIEGRFKGVNIAGPREEKRPGIYALVAAVLEHVIQEHRKLLGR
ncbi:MAG: hypothetical protein F9K36_02735 [Burkholderiaceae bacterium]|nr:MAG: hypothetical protein F9K36_02735 [Burkholderiaceae bacterium]